MSGPIGDDPSDAGMVQFATDQLSIRPYGFAVEASVAQPFASAAQVLAYENCQLDQSQCGSAQPQRQLAAEVGHESVEGHRVVVFDPSELQFFVIEVQNDRVLHFVPFVG